MRENGLTLALTLTLSPGGEGTAIGALGKVRLSPVLSPLLLILYESERQSKRVRIYP
jgi:hypothetical protein